MTDLGESFIFHYWCKEMIRTSVQHIRQWALELGTRVCLWSWCTSLGASSCVPRDSDESSLGAAKIGRKNHRVVNENIAISAPARGSLINSSGWVGFGATFKTWVHSGESFMSDNSFCLGSCQFLAASFHFWTGLASSWFKPIYPSLLLPIVLFVLFYVIPQ